jgi:hypothetical protein
LGSIQTLVNANPGDTGYGNAKTLFESLVGDDTTAKDAAVSEFDTASSAKAAQQTVVDGVNT